MYSADLRELINLMLDKDEKQRPSVIDILRMDFMKGHMREFIETQGKINFNPKLKVRQENLPTVVEK